MAVRIFLAYSIVVLSNLNIALANPVVESEAGVQSPAPTTTVEVPVATPAPAAAIAPTPAPIPTPVSAPAQTLSPAPVQTPIPVQTPMPVQMPNTQPASAVPVVQQIVPEVFYQPAGGKRAIELALLSLPESSADVVSSTTGIKGGEVHTSGGGLGLRFGYGLADSTAVALQMVYSNMKQEAVTTSGSSVSAKASGLEDVALQLQHIAKGLGSNFYVAVQGKFSPEKGRDATLTSEGNQASGGISITPRVGLSSTVNPSATLAAYVSYTSKGDRVRRDNATPSRDYTVTGGNVISIRGLMEFQFSQSTFSIGLGSDKYETSTTDYAGTKTSSAGRTIAILDLGSTVTFNESTEMVLAYQAAMVPEQDVSTSLKQSSYTQSALAASLRFEF